MQSSNRELFLAWRERRKPADLATVFDRTAPELLRVALHLVGDAATAEDLVQGTFLTAMEKARAFDGARELEPWLVGILQQHARDVVRAARRRPEPERLVERVQELPDHALLERELSAELVRAIDGLDEPYRQTLLLRARHGLAAADIAHVLGESPGTIRVRIHRGIELLKRALPAGVALGALALLEPARGLAAVKTVVLAQAAQGAVLGAAGVGGVLVGKKLVVAGAVVIALALLLGWWLRNDSKAARDVRVASTNLEPERAAETPPAPKLERAETAAPRASIESSAVATNIATDPPMKGRVVDGVTGAPIAGARIELHAAQSVTLLELAARFPEQMGGAIPRWRAPYDEWPWFETPPSELALAGRERVSALVPPTTGSAPLASIESDADGRFEMPKGTPWGFLVCTKPGYAARSVPGRRVETRFVYMGNRPREVRVEHEAVVLRMWPELEIDGRVVTPDGGELNHELAFQLVGYSSAPTAAASDAPSIVQDYDPTSVGTWTVRTDVHGRFHARVAAHHVQAHSIDPEWTFVGEGVHPESRERWAFGLAFNLPPEMPVLLGAARSASLVVTSQATGAPVEELWLVARGTVNGYPFWTGRFHAPRGRLRLTEETLRMLSTGREGEPQRLTVWAEGFAPASATLTDVQGAETIELALPAGTAPELAGSVVEGGAPLAGATVALLAISRLQWSPDEPGLVDAVKTEGDGRFSFHAPAGEYALRFRAGARTRMLPVTIPAPREVVFTMDRGASMSVRVEDADGKPERARGVVVRSSSGEQRFVATSDAGLARFDDLVAGAYEVLAPFRSAQDAFRGTLQESVELADGETRELVLRVPRLTPRHPKLVVVGDDPGGWRARLAFADDARWIVAEPNALLPIDVASGGTIEVERGSVERWTFVLPKDAPDGYELVVHLGGAGYVGRLIDGDSGAPCARWTVQVGNRAERAHCTQTDADGRFDVAVPEGERPTIAFWFAGRRDGDPLVWSDSSPWIEFEPAAPAAAQRATLELAVPREFLLESARDSASKLRGRVRRSGAPAPRIWASATVERRLAGGVLRARLPAGHATSDAEGRFELGYASGERLRVDFWALDDRTRFEPTWIELTTSGGVLERDFELP